MPHDTPPATSAAAPETSTPGGPAPMANPTSAGPSATEPSAAVAMATTSAPADASPAASTSPTSPTAEDDGLVSITDFARLDLRVGTVVHAERIPKADRLLRLEVDLGEGAPRQILAGIAAWYAPESLVGRQILVVANLQPRRLRGLESHGMLLAASVGDDGRPVLASVSEPVPNGARLR